MRQNAFATGAPPRTPLGSLQRSPDSLGGFGEGNKEGEMKRAREGKETEGEGEGERKGRGERSQRGNENWGVASLVLGA